MGSAEKLKREGEVLRFDFAAPTLRVSKTDRVGLAMGEGGEKDETKVVPRAVRFCIGQVITAAFASKGPGDPGGMDRKSGKFWAAWQEVMDDDPIQAEVTRGQVEFLKKYFEAEDLKVAPALAQWREAVLEYIEELLAPKPAEEAKPVEAESAAP